MLAERLLYACINVNAYRIWFQTREKKCIIGQYSLCPYHLLFASSDMEWPRWCLPRYCRTKRNELYATIFKCAWIVCGRSLARPLIQFEFFIFHFFFLAVSLSLCLPLCVSQNTVQDRLLSFFFFIAQVVYFFRLVCVHIFFRSFASVCLRIACALNSVVSVLFQFWSLLFLILNTKSERKVS